MKDKIYIKKIITEGFQVREEDLIEATKILRKDEKRLQKKDDLFFQQFIRSVK
jgi:archaellum biogenesis protein FlaJ (TadC family)